MFTFDPLTHFREISQKYIIQDNSEIFGQYMNIRQVRVSLKCYKELPSVWSWASDTVWSRRREKKQTNLRRCMLGYACEEEKKKSQKWHFSRGWSAVAPPTSFMLPVGGPKVSAAWPRRAVASARTLFFFFLLFYFLITHWDFRQ